MQWYILQVVFIFKQRTETEGNCITRFTCDLWNIKLVAEVQDVNTVGDIHVGKDVSDANSDYLRNNEIVGDHQNVLNIASSDTDVLCVKVSDACLDSVTVKIKIDMITFLLSEEPLKIFSLRRKDDFVALDLCVVVVANNSKVVEMLFLRLSRDVFSETSHERTIIFPAQCLDRTISVVILLLVRIQNMHFKGSESLDAVRIGAAQPSLRNIRVVTSLCPIALGLKINSYTF